METIDYCDKDMDEAKGPQEAATDPSPRDHVHVHNRDTRKDWQEGSQRREANKRSFDHDPHTATTARQISKQRQQRCFVSSFTHKVLKTYPGETPEKRESRLERNRETARQSRLRHKRYLEELNNDIKHFTSKNHGLLLEIESFRNNSQYELFRLQQQTEALMTTLDQLLAENEQLKRRRYEQYSKIACGPAFKGGSRVAAGGRPVPAPTSSRGPLAHSLSPPGGCAPTATTVQPPQRNTPTPALGAVVPPGLGGATVGENSSPCAVPPPTVLANPAIDGSDVKYAPPHTATIAPPLSVFQDVFLPQPTGAWPAFQAGLTP